MRQHFRGAFRRVFPKSAPPSAQTLVDYRGARFFAGPGNKIEKAILDGTYDNYALNFVSKFIHPGFVCLDVGANIGAYSVFLSIWSGPNGTVHAFEPVDHIRTKAALNLQLNGYRNVVLNNFALGDRPGEAVMNQIRSDQFRGGTSSLLPTENMDELGESAFIKKSVRIETMDRYVHTAGLDKIDFIKMDVEGFELSVLRGAIETLGRLRPIVYFEHSRPRLAKLGIDEASFEDIFSQADYEVFAFWWTGDRFVVSPYKFDGVNASRDLIALPRSINEP